tara:strand:+ start:814 stop:1044 length:231 start_codon:yes stop_codon:yes gene_type:complete
MIEKIKKLEIDNALLTYNVKMCEEEVSNLKYKISISMNNIRIPKCYVIDEADKEVYDFELMREIFENELTKLKNNE